MDCKLICIDMDGTLLNDKKTINEENLETIKKATEKGIKVAVCTGRLFASARYFGAVLGVKSPIIASNGGYIRDRDSEKVIYEVELGYENCVELQKIVEKYDFKIFYNTPESVIAATGFPKNYDYVRHNEMVPDEFKVKLVDSKDIYASLKSEGDKVLKCICISEKGNRELIDKVKKEIRALNKYEVVSSGENNFEVMRKGISKGRAVKELAEFYNIKREEVMCIGDNENDLSMIEYAGIGVAMGNGSDLIKKTADFITDTNNNSGVAKAIEKFALKN